MPFLLFFYEKCRSPPNNRGLCAYFHAHPPNFIPLKHHKQPSKLLLTPPSKPQAPHLTLMHLWLGPHRTARGVTQTMYSTLAQTQTPKYTHVLVHERPSACPWVCPHCSFSGYANRAAAPVDGVCPPGSSSALFRPCCVASGDPDVRHSSAVRWIICRLNKE